MPPLCILNRLVFLQRCLFLLDNEHCAVNLLKLPGPRGVVEERAKVETVVVWAVGLGVVGGCQGCHLVSVNRVVEEEPLDLDGNLRHFEAIAPKVNQLSEHGVRTALLHLPQSTKLGQFVVGHTHVDFI